jgi:SAM-dependent methyltransferase
MIHFSPRFLVIAMHSTILSAFRNILSGLDVQGRVLEIGAIPSTSSLLALDVLEKNERIGINLDGNIDFGGFRIVEGNANDMPMFPEAHFDCVLSNATIEHDAFFWRTLSEVRRVLRRGGVMIIGAPGFTDESGVARLGIEPPWEEDDLRSWRNSALTFRFHGAPDDYYRFSPSAFREVIFAGYSDVAIRSLMVPPRLIGYGFRL